MSDEQEKKDLPEEGNGKEHNVPDETEQASPEGRSVREPGGGGAPEEGASSQADEGGPGEAGGEASRLRGLGYISIEELRAALKRCYKHVSSGEVPVVVMITGLPQWYPITNCEAIENAADGSQAIVISLMPMPNQTKSGIEVVKKMPRRPEDDN